MTNPVRDNDDPRPGTPATGGRPLHPVPDEPPYDYPTEDPYLQQTQAHQRATDRNTIADRATEHALLAVLINEPDTADKLTGHIETSDFYWPLHQTIWNAWHHLRDTASGIAPDAILLGQHFMRSRDKTSHEAVTLIAQLMGNPATGLHAEAYAKTIRDHARLRDVNTVATQLRQLVTDRSADDIEATLGEALQRIDETVMRFGPRTTSTSSSGLVDLGWILTGTPPQMPAPTYTTRTDGHALFYAGKVNGIFGDPEAAKTWLAMTAVIEALNAGGTAAMIDVDHNGPDHTVARLLLLGAHPHDLADPTRFRYYEPHEADELLAAVDDITRQASNVVVIDSIGEVFPMLGVSTNDGDEMTTALRRTCIRPANAGSCVITIDHLPKGEDARKSGFAIGTIAKKRMIRGSYIRAEARTQPAPGQIGRITLRIEKDPTGSLRKVTPGGYAGTFVIDSTHSEDQGTTSWRVERDEAPKNDDGTVRPTHLMEKVSRFVEQNDQCSKNAIESARFGKATYVRAALDLLIEEGFITPIPGRAGHSVYHSIAMYREDEDDHA